MATLDMTLGEVCRLVDGSKLVGDAAFHCHELRGLDDAGSPDLAFVRGRKQIAEARKSGAGALLVPERIEGIAAHQIVVAEPVAALARLLASVDARQEPPTGGVHPTAFVEKSAEIGADVHVGPGAVIDHLAVVEDGAMVHARAFVGPRCRVGPGSVLHPNVVLRQDVTLGARVVVRSASVLGSDGYGYIPSEAEPVRVAQVGGVSVGDDVEIGALATIDRATFGTTRIGDGTKIGDMVHVGHNCKIGKNVMLLPMVGVAGSVEIGDGAIMAGRSSCADNLKIGERARVGANSVVFKDVGAGEEVWGRPARSKTREARIQSLLGRLPELFREVARLKRD